MVINIVNQAFQMDRSILSNKDNGHFHDRWCKAKYILLLKSQTILLKFI